MINKHEIKRTRSQRGVGSIIGGVILAAILFTSVLVFFITILKNEQAKTSYEILSAQANQDKASERFSVVREHDLEINGGIYIVVHINNDGSLPLVASKILLYCLSAGCPPPAPDPEDKSPLQGIALNAQEKYTGSVGPVSTGEKYRVDVITERGNILSTVECQVNGAICENDPDRGGDPEPPCIECAVTEGIIQGTGSVQLDFRAFGSIYPNYGSRAGINQQGWLVLTSSPIGNVTGYPAFEIPFSPVQGAQGIPDFPVAFVERMRNLDQYNETLTLTRATSLLTNIGKEQGNQQDIVFICNATKTFSGGQPSGGTLAGYHETLRKTVLSWVPLNAGTTVGWQEVFFCTQNPGSGTANYSPRNTFNSFHPLFVVLRGSFDPSHSDYGQTIPYQSALPGGTSEEIFEACLRSSNTPSSGHTCPGPSALCDNACATNAALVYSGMKSVMTGAGMSVWIHLDAVTSPVTVSWIYPNGTQVVLEMTNNQLAKDQTLNGNGYIPFAVRLPKDVTCNVGSTSQSYIIKVSDQYDSSGRRNVYYMTWKVTC